MLIDEIKKILNDYEIQAITKLNYEEATEVYNSNQEFFILTEDTEPDIMGCLESIDQIPPNFSLENKFFVSIWRNGSMVGILDILVGFPHESDIGIGLLLIHGELHGKKLGSKIVNAVLEAAKIEGFTSIQIGVIDNNIKALNFWEKLGFEKIRESQVEREEKSDWNIIVMKKHIA